MCEAANFTTNTDHTRNPQQSEKRATCVLIQSETETGFSCERVLKRTHRTELSLTNISTCLCSFVKVTHSADSVVMESRTEASCHAREPNRTSSGSRDTDLTATISRLSSIRLPRERARTQLRLWAGLPLHRSRILMMKNLNIITYLH